MRLLSTLAVRLAFERGIIPAFPHPVEAAWMPTAVALSRLDDGFDLAVLTDEALAGRGLDRVPVARSALGLAVRAGAPRPGIGTEAEFRQALLGARSLAWSRAGASGIHLEGVLDSLGIGEEVRARGTVITQGFTAECLLDGRADLAVQQVSELLMVEGTEVIGPFPERFQARALFSAAILPGAARPGVAREFLAALRTPEAAAALRGSGLDPAA